MKRGDIITVADASGDFSGKPRPALVVQSDLYEDHHSVTTCLITSQTIGLSLFRIPIASDRHTGLRLPSEIAIDKIQTIWAHRVGKLIGRATDDILFQVDDALRRWLTL